MIYYQVFQSINLYNDLAPCRFEYRLLKTYQFKIIRFSYATFFFKIIVRNVIGVSTTQTLCFCSHSLTMSRKTLICIPFSSIRYFFIDIMVREELYTRWTCCLLYTSPSPRDGLLSRMPSSA